MLVVTRCKCQSRHTSCCVPGAYWCAKSRTDSACSDSGVSSATELPDVVIGCSVSQLLLCSDDIMPLQGRPAVFRRYQVQNSLQTLDLQRRLRAGLHLFAHVNGGPVIWYFTPPALTHLGDQPREQVPERGLGAEVWPPLTNATGDLRKPFEIFLRETALLALHSRPSSNCDLTPYAVTRRGGLA